jgi:hypothetical protein
MWPSFPVALIFIEMVLVDGVDSYQVDADFVISGATADRVSRFIERGDRDGAVDQTLAKMRRLWSAVSRSGVPLFRFADLGVAE